MNSYVNWITFFAQLTALRCLRIIPTYYPRYYDWAKTELSDWSTADFVHKAFFRELFAAIPGHVIVEIGLSTEATGAGIQGMPIDTRFLQDMIEGLGAWLVRLSGT